MRKLAVVAALLTVATGVVSGTAGAAPKPAVTAPVNFTANTDETRSVITTDAGSIGIEGGVLKIRADDGTVVAGTELKYRLDDFELPIAADISGRTVTLTPQVDAAQAVYRPVALPYENQAPWKTEYEREQAAWSRLTSTVSAGATIGTLVGGITGGAIGCVLGGITAGTLTAGTIGGLFGPFIPAAAVGCLVGIAAVGAIGTITGQILVTAPVAIAAAVQYFTTINAPFTPAPAK